MGKRVKFDGDVCVRDVCVRAGMACAHQYRFLKRRCDCDLQLGLSFSQKELSLLDRISVLP